MKILVIGSGGREHALAWAIKQNPKCDQLICAPGNAGMQEIAECHPLDINDNAATLAFCQRHKVDFVVIGPEAPLASGLADDLRAAGFLCFGPSAAAAQLESSKHFTKQICDACSAPTAAYGQFDTKQAALAYLANHSAPIVVKADGLAAGKGVIVAMNMEEAIQAVDEIFSGAFGEAGTSVVIEEFMEGEEASLFVLCDGKNTLSIGTAQDHKRAFDGDLGPNTGGMGAYSPAPVLDGTVLEKAMAEIIHPTVAEMAARGTPFEGVLYAGLMIKDGQPRLVEYNVRFGDPECQVLMMRIGAQVLDALLACAEQKLDQMKIHWADDHAMTIVYAAEGYPGSYNKNTIINGLEEINSNSSLQVFHAGTRLDETSTPPTIRAVGGRVLAITGRGSSLRQARDRAYDNLEKLDWPDGFYRKDIGWRALN